MYAFTHCAFILSIPLEYRRVLHYTTESGSMRHTPSGGKFTLEKFSFCHCMLESLYQFCSFWVTLVSVTSKSCYQLAESEAQEASL